MIDLDFQGQAHVGCQHSQLGGAVAGNPGILDSAVFHPQLQAAVVVVDGQILSLGQDGRYQLFHGGSGQAHRVDGGARLVSALELRRLESVIEHTCQCRRIGFHADAAGNRPTLGVAQSLVRKVDGLIVLFHGVDGGSLRLPGIVPEAFLYGQTPQIRAQRHLGT